MYNKRVHPTTLLSIHQFTADNVFTFEMLMPPAHVFNFRRREIRKIVKRFVDGGEDFWLKRLFGHPSRRVSPGKVTIDTIRSIECLASRDIKNGALAIWVYFPVGRHPHDGEEYAIPLGAIILGKLCRGKCRVTYHVRMLCRERVVFWRAVRGRRDEDAVGEEEEGGDEEEIEGVAEIGRAHV